MSEALVDMPIVLVCKTHSAVTDFDQGLSWANLSMTLGLDNLSTLGAFEDGEVNPHVETPGLPDAFRQFSDV